jgi:uncharacterized membrane protein
MSENLIFIGILIIFIGIILLFAGIILAAMKSKGSKTEGGFIIWIGPFPIVGASSKEMFYALLLLSAIFIFFFLIIFKR